ncbi:helix-turn-helix transcriptional regulator [Micromonospora sp. NPDC000207]|uniref:helix-turn-helix domain-containing protein n=1 Tax=Micromonospora sp. NPDC000207 TaxID=3154246 RepID=UPI0033278546
MNATAVLIDELRRCRSSRGLNQEEFGRMISYSGTHVSAVESGTRPPTAEYVRAIDRTMETGGLFTRLLDRLPPLDQTPVWLREWITVEEQAVSLRWYEPVFVPGLLQTEAYARATLRAGELDASQIEQRVRSRIDRQAILNRDQPPNVVVMLDEAVLRRTVDGDRDLMREQVDHLIAAAGLPNVKIYVVPEDAGLYSGLQGGFILANLPDGLVFGHVDSQVRSETIGARTEVVTLESIWETCARSALPRRLSLDLIKEVAQSWS